MNRGADCAPGKQEVSCLSHPPQIPSLQLQQFMLTTTEAHREATAAFLLMKTTSVHVCLVGAYCDAALQQLYSEVTSYLLPNKSLLFSTGSEELLLLRLEVCREAHFTHITHCTSLKGHLKSSLFLCSSTKKDSKHLQHTLVTRHTVSYLQ